MIRAEHIKFAYHGMNPVLNDLSMKEDLGHCVALLGNNGAGKSTFLKCLNRILKPADGIVILDEKNIQTLKRGEIAKKISYVEQHTCAGRLTVYDTVLLGRKPHMGYGPSKKDYEIVDDAIKRMHLEHMTLRYTDELSGGELQKVALARALAQQPKMLLLDEPTASLDLKNQHEVMQIVSEIAKKDHILVVIVIHDLNLALKYCDRFMLFKDGEGYRYGNQEVITSETIKDVYGVDAELIELQKHKMVLVK